MPMPGHNISALFVFILNGSLHRKVILIHSSDKKNRRNNVDHTIISQTVTFVSNQNMSTAMLKKVIAAYALLSVRN